MKRSGQIILFVIAIAVFLAAWFSVLYVNKLPREASIGINGEAFIALNKEAVKAEVKSPSRHPYLFYKFTLNQKVNFSTRLYKDSGCALEVALELPETFNEQSASYAIGFLYQEDFKKENRLNKTISSRNLVSGVFPVNAGLKTVVLAFNVPSGAIVPEGFFVYSKAKVKVKNVKFTEPKLGWSRSDDAGFFAMGPDGGECDFTFTKADFTSAPQFFGSENTASKVMPKIVLTLTDTETAGDIASQDRVIFEYAGESVTVRRAPHQTNVTLQTSAFYEPFSKLKFVKNAQMVTSVLLVANDVSLLPVNEKVITPFVTDLGMIFKWNQASWRREDYELFEWEEFPGVLFFDFADYNIQNLFFTRLAYFVEKAGYKGTFVDDEFIQTAHGYNAHDYKADDLAHFFTQAELKGVALNDYEKLLCEILVNNKIIVPLNEGGYKAGKGAVISISRQSLDYQRYTLLAHESWHGIYFIDEEFRDTSYIAYSLFDPVSMEFLKTYWETQPTLAYDRNDEYLMRNEFMAYILQSPVSSIKDYWLSRAKWNSVQRSEKELADYIIENGAMSFSDACDFLSSYVFDRWGFVAGRVYLISRESLKQ